MEFSFPSNLSGDFYLLKNRSKNHSHDKLNRKQLPLWSCFAFITRNIDQNKATKSLYAYKTAGMPIDCVSVDTLLIQVAKWLL